MKAKYDALHSSEELSELAAERKDMIERGVSDIANSNRIVLSALGAYGDASHMIETLEKGGFVANYINQRKIELIKQNGEFNLLLTTLSQYMQVIIETLVAELGMGQNGAPSNDGDGAVAANGDVVASDGSQADGSTDAELSEEEVLRREAQKQAAHGEQLAIYQSWLQRTFEVNSVLEKRLIFIEGLLRALKVDVTNLQVHQMEQQAADRRRAIAEQRYKKTIEDVKDYEDLEGQYRHHYDEEGNLVETVEGGQGGNKRGIMVSAILLGIVLIGIIVYIFLKGAR